MRWPGSRRGLLDGDLAAPRVLRLESVSSTGRDSDLDGGLRRWQGPGNGGAHLGSRCGSPNEYRGALGGRQIQRPLGHSATRMGTVSEGPYVDDERNGHWVVRLANGQVQEGPYLDGEPNGHWVIRSADGNTMEGPYVNGVQHGRWIWRSADGDDVAEVLFEEGEERDMNILKLGGEDVR